MRDVLYDTIREFNDKANPIFAEWGLVSMLKRFFPIGFGTVAKRSKVCGRVREAARTGDPEVPTRVLAASPAQDGRLC